MFRVQCLILSIFAFLITGCDAPRSENEIWLGTISGPETELVYVAKEVAKREYNLDITIIEFDDYNIPNIALHDGSIDANLFQHKPFLDLTIEHRGYDLTSIAEMFIYPMGLYSKIYKSMDDIPNGARIGIPSDPSNGARALRLLAKHGYISIPDLDDLSLSPSTISENPHRFRFIEMDAAQLPRSLSELDAAVINTTFAMPAKLIPSKDALLIEDKSSPYANVVVVRTDSQDHLKYAQLIKALHSEQVELKAKELFQDQAIAAWK